MIALIASLACLQDPAFDTLTLDAGSRCDRLIARDLNGDGRPDLLVQNGRDLHVFLFDRGFSPKPQQTLRLDAAVFLWTLGALDGRKHPALFTAGSRGVQVHPFDGRAFAAAGADAIVHPSIFQGLCSEAKGPVHLDFAPDLDGDGRSDVILFLEEEIFLMKQAAGGEFLCRQKLPVPVDVAVLIPWAPHQKLTELAAVPVLTFGDVDGDGRQDLSYYKDEAIGVFKQDGQGRFLPAVGLDLTVEKRKRRSRFFQLDVPPRVGDFNADGLLDVALVYPSKGRVHLYYGRAGRTDFTQADDIMKVADGWSTGIYLDDLNADGKPDLIMGVVRKFGLTDGIQVFLSGRVSLELHVYPMQDGGRFAKDPVQELTFSIPFSFHVTRESMQLDLIFRPNFKGDFNRDGLRDMLVSADDRTLRIYPGDRERLIRGEPTGSIVTNPPAGTGVTEPFIADFNGDGVSDLVLKHTLSTDPPKHALELKLSK
jgi:hypothetical protein